MRATHWLCVLGLSFVGGVAACGPGATGTSDAGPDAPRSDAGAALDADTGAPPAGETGIDAPAESSTQCPDLDDDGHGAAACGDDCDDTDRRRYPGARELCDGEGRDEDCNPCTVGEVIPGGMGGDSDRDEDGFPSVGCFNRITGEAMPVCASSGGTVDAGAEPEARVRVDPVARETRGRDCDDSAVTRNPAAPEVCDAAMQDENCNSMRNEGCACPTGTSRPCEDSPGVRSRGVCAAGMQDCIDGVWGRCSVSPSEETCNLRDDDCDGETDESMRTECFRDGDGDGFAAPGTEPSRECGVPMAGALGCPAGFTATPPGADTTDCDDTNSARSPRISEIPCNRVDDDCRASTDDTTCPLSGQTCATGGCTCDGGQVFCGGSCATPMTCPVGRGRCATTVLAECVGGRFACPAMHMGNASAARPEVCDGVDDDCDGVVDNGLVRDCWTDRDNDGFAPRGATSERLCNPSMPATPGCPARTTSTPPATSEDCDDDNTAARPGGTEVRCNGVDENCNGSADDAASGACYGGAAGTAGVGLCRAGTRSCSGGAEVCTGDVGPAAESCDGLDNDCNGTVDDGAGFTCRMGATRSCSVCTSMSGTERCGASCQWSRSCDVGTVPQATVLAWNDARWVNTGYCEPRPTRTPPAMYCISGPTFCSSPTVMRRGPGPGMGLSLGPADYSARFVGSTTKPAILEVRTFVPGSGNLVGTVVAMQSVPAGDYDRTLTFTVPACLTVEFRTYADRDVFGMCNFAFYFADTTVTRLSPYRL